MKQTLKKSLLLGVLLLLLLAFAVPFSAFAEDTTYTVTVMVKFGSESGSAIPDNGTYVQVYGATKLTENTYSFSPTSGEQLRFVSNSLKGYRVYQWEVEDSVEGSSTSSLYVTDYTVGSISGDSTVTVVFHPEEYDISYENEEDFNGASLSFTATPPYVHTYGQSTALVAPKTLQTHTFRYWTVYTVDGTTRTLHGTREAGEVLNANEITSDLVLVAHWEPKSFAVTRVDLYRDENGDEHEFDAATPVTKSAEYASSVSGKDDDWENDVSHRGYTFDAATAVEGTDYTVLDSVSHVEANNRVFRYYTARTYTVVFDNCDLASVTHTFGRPTVLVNPSRIGYTFAGWQITRSNGDDWKAGDVTVETDGTWSLNGSGGVWTLFGDTYDSGVPGTDVSIRLRAKWEPVRYTISYDPATIYGNDVSALKSGYYYEDGETVTVPDSFGRDGYAFLGWRVLGSSEEPAKPFVIGARERAENITLEAVWQANVYTVTFDPANGSPAETADVTFDGALPAITVPAREGYDFTGYFLGGERYYNADGTAVEGKTWTTVGSATLTAEWTIRKHTVAVSVTDGQGNDRSARVTVTVNGAAYDPAAEYDYGTELTVRVEVRAGESDKIVGWNGAAVAHGTAYSATFSLGDRNEEIAAIILPKAATPAFGVDYVGETLTGFAGAEGVYRVEAGGAMWSFRVAADGSVSPYDGDHADPARLSEVFGNTRVVLKVVRCGNGVSDSDSDAQEIELAARPAAPRKEADQIRVSAPVSDRAKLEIALNVGNLVYEYAYTRSETAVPENWQDSPVFENLNAGTPYYVHVRVKAVEGVCPHGEVYTEQATTRRDAFLREWIEKLYRDFEPYTGGENVKALLESAEREAAALEPAADYEEELDSIYRGVAEQIGFEKSRDDAIAELRAYYEGLVATEAYRQSGNETLLALLEEAINAINSGATASEVDVQRASLAAHKGMDEVRVNYLSSVTAHSEVRLYSPAGLAKGTVLSAEQGDAASVRSQLRAALRRGTVVVSQEKSDRTDAASARKLLSSMDAVAFYRMFLSSRPEEGDLLEFRLLIPENLRSESGFVVAYYDNRTETVTVLETRREGNELAFWAPSAADFVVFSEHVTNTAPILAVLSCVLLLQVVAIAVILAGRGRAKAYSAAFPLMAALAVRVSPSGSLTAVIVLGALAVVLQIVLVWLVVATGITWRKKPEPPEAGGDDERNPEPADEAVPTLLDETVDTEAEQGPPLTSLTEDDLPPDGYQVSESLDPETSEEESAVDWTGARTVTTETTVTTKTTETTRVVKTTDGAERDFMEPPANPKYSLPEEPAVPAFAESGETAKAPETAATAPKRGESAGANPFAEQAEGLWGEESKNRPAKPNLFDLDRGE